MFKEIMVLLIVLMVVGVVLFIGGGTVLGTLGGVGVFLTVGILIIIGRRI